jgi:hypothetical protein
LTAVNPTRSQTPIAARSPRLEHRADVALELAAVGQAGQRVGERLVAVPAGVALGLLGVQPGRDAVQVAVAEAVDALGGEAERVPVGGVRGGVVAGRGVADAAQAGRLGGAEDLGGDRHGVQHGQCLRRLAGRDREADVAEVVQVAGADAVAAAGQPLRRVRLGLLAQRGAAGQRVAVGRAAAGAHLVGADRDVAGQLGVDVAQHTQAAVGVALVVEGDRVAQPDAGRREDLGASPTAAPTCRACSIAVSAWPWKPR